MSREIKIIQCPQCGSTQNTPLENRHYRCNSCNTEYFIESNDININVNHNVTSEATTGYDSLSMGWQTTIKVALGIGVFLLAYNIPSWLSSSPSPTSAAPISQAKPPVQRAAPAPRESQLYYYAFANENNKKPVQFVLLDRVHGSSTARDEKDRIIATFSDLQTGKVLKEQQIAIPGKKQIWGGSIRSQAFDNGMRYLIINDTKLYEINDQQLTFTDVTDAMFSKQSVFDGGVATIQFPNVNDNSFIVMTNDGKQLYYYPLINKVYDKDARYNAQFGFNSLIGKGVAKTYYVFTGESMHFKDEKKQLIKVNYKSNNGGPEARVYSPSWYKDFGGSGIFNERSPYKKVLFDANNYRVTGYKDLTPDRLYFAPSVSYSDEEYLLISTDVNAAPDAPRNLQSLDINTGKVLWTLPVSASNYRISRYADGFILYFDVNNYQLIDFDGKQISASKGK